MILFKRAEVNVEDRAASAKGARKREEILDAALMIFSAEGYRGTSLRTVASRVGLTVAGVLHYFSSREELLTAVVTRRDELNHAKVSTHESPYDFLEILERNSSQPGLVELFVSLSAAARNPEHPAHEALAARYEALRIVLAEKLREQQELGHVRPDLDPRDLASLLISAADGAQLQWLVDGSQSLSGPFELLLHDILSVPRRSG